MFLHFPVYNYRCLCMENCTPCICIIHCIYMYGKLYFLYPIHFVYLSISIFCHSIFCTTSFVALYNMCLEYPQCSHFFNASFIVFIYAYYPVSSYQFRFIYTNFCFLYMHWFLWYTLIRAYLFDMYFVNIYVVCLYICCLYTCCLYTCYLYLCGLYLCYLYICCVYICCLYLCCLYICCLYICCLYICCVYICYVVHTHFEFLIRRSVQHLSMYARVIAK